MNLYKYIGKTGVNDYDEEENEKQFIKSENLQQITLEKLLTLKKMRMIVYKSKLKDTLPNQQLLALSTLNSKIKILFLETFVTMGIWMSLRRIFFRKFNIYIYGFANNFWLDAVVPSIFILYRGLYTVPKLASLIFPAFPEYIKDMQIQDQLNEEFMEMIDEKAIYEREFNQKYYTNAQYWH